MKNNIIDECVRREIERFLNEEVRQLEIPFDFDDDGRSKVDTYQKGYHHGNHGEIERLAHEVKKNDMTSISKIADLLATKVNAVEPIFVPMPNHNGYAEYTLKISQILADKCNGKCCDILSGDARETLHGMKKKGINPKTINMNFRIKNGAMFDDSMFDRIIYVVDNVLDTGTTYEAAKQVIQHIFGKDADIRLLTLATTNNSGNRYNIR